MCRHHFLAPQVSVISLQRTLPPRRWKRRESPRESRSTDGQTFGTGYGKLFTGGYARNYEAMRGDTKERRSRLGG